MKGRGLVIVGAGGAGREILALVRDIERHTPSTWDFQGFMAVDPPEVGLLERLGATFLGDPRDGLPRFTGSSTWAFVVGIGDPQLRRRNDELMLMAGLEPTTLVHPSAWIGPDVEIAVGSVISANTVITTNVRIGRSAQVNIGCVIAHDNRLGNYVTLAQSVNLAGAVTVEEEATIFTRATVIPGVTVGSGATIGAGAVVISDVAPHTTVVGVPAMPKA